MKPLILGLPNLFLRSFSQSVAGHVSSFEKIKYIVQLNNGKVMYQGALII